jgi:hypothetical protein
MIVACVIAYMQHRLSRSKNRNQRCREYQRKDRPSFLLLAFCLHIALVPTVFKLLYTFELHSVSPHLTHAMALTADAIMDAANQS